MGLFSDILLTVDFDRTLTATDSTIPKRNLEAIEYFIANGGAFTVNTGRSLPMARIFRDQVPVNAPLLLYNGSAAYDLEKECFTFTHTIDLDMTQTLARVTELFPDLRVEVQGVDAHYIFTQDPAWDAFTDKNCCARGHARLGDDLGPFLKFALYGQIRSDTVADLYATLPGEQARMDAAERQLKELLGGHCEVFRAAARIIDVHAKGVSKCLSARQLQRHLGRKILVCVGDADNDLSMLEGADYAFCPAGSIVADRFENVCTCDEGAVADVIFEKIPQILKTKLDK